jgi:ApeA N-terminal domain 1
MIADASLPLWDPSHSYRGRWWPAGNTELNYRGTLRFTERRPTLTLKAPPIGQEVFELGRVATLHGQLESGQLVTLWDLQGHHLQHERRAAKDGSSQHHRTFNYAILGGHVGDYEEATFSYSAYRLHDLSEWSRLTTLTDHELPSDQLPQFEAARVVGMHQEDFGVEFSVEARLEHPMRVQTDATFPGGAIFDHTGDDVRVVFHTDPPAPARYHNLLLFDLQSLLTFSYQGGAPVLGEWFALKDMNDPLPVLRHDSFNGHNPSRKWPDRMVLSAEVGEPMQFLSAWWKAVDELFPTTQIIGAYHHGARGVLEGSVSSAIAAAERMHELLGATKTRFAPELLALRQKEIRAKYSGKEHSEFRQFIGESFRNNRLTLKTRLGELADLVTVERLRAMSINPDDWIEEVKAVRDKLAHTGSHVDRRDNDASNLLDRVNVQTRAIVSVLVIQWMGASEEALDRAASALHADVSWFPPPAR